jgi:transposase
MAEVINQFWVGIDVAKAKFDAAVFPDGMQPERWRQLETKSFASDKKGVAAFVRWIQTLGGCCAGMCAESTGIYSADLAEALHEKAPDLPLLAIVNPARVKATAKTFGTKDKSDSVDARVIAAFAAWHRPKPTPLRSPEWQNLRSLFLARESLLADAVAYEQRAQVSRDKDCIASHRRTAKRLYAEAEFFDKKIEAAIANEPTFAKHDKLLRSIPGIGPVISCAILALFGDLTKWTRGEATSAAGLFPRKCESGTSVRGKPCMSKGGGGLLRKKLYMGAIRLLTKDRGFNRSVLRLREQNRPKMVCLGAAMRKLLLVARAVLVSGKPYDANHAAPA